MSELLLNYPSLVVNNYGQGTSYTIATSGSTSFVVDIYGQTGMLMSGAQTGYGTTFVYPYSTINSASYTNS